MCVLTQAHTGTRVPTSRFPEPTLLGKTALSDAVFPTCKMETPAFSSVLCWGHEEGSVCSSSLSFWFSLSWKRSLSWSP